MSDSCFSFALSRLEMELILKCQIVSYIWIYLLVLFNTVVSFNTHMSGYHLRGSELPFHLVPSGESLE